MTDTDTMVREDLPQVARLEADLFDCPLLLQALETLFSGPAFYGLVRRGDDRQICAYLLAHLADGHAEILSLGTDPVWQRNGFARLMLARFLSAACEKTGGTVTLEVAIDNHAAIALYEKHGFGTVGKRANYYRRDGYRCDALVMQFDAASPFS